jgi:hypothetical protein
MMFGIVGQFLGMVVVKNRWCESVISPAADKIHWWL